MSGKVYTYKLFRQLRCLNSSWRQASGVRRQIGDENSQLNSRRGGKVYTCKLLRRSGACVGDAQQGGERQAEKAQWLITMVRMRKNNPVVRMVFDSDFSRVIRTASDILLPENHIHINPSNSNSRN
jgi:hypothetical protein